jgi:hypothetical protein
MAIAAFAALALALMPTLTASAAKTTAHHRERRRSSGRR